MSFALLAGAVPPTWADRRTSNEPDDIFGLRLGMQWATCGQREVRKQREMTVSRHHSVTVEGMPDLHKRHSPSSSVTSSGLRPRLGPSVVPDFTCWAEGRMPAVIGRLRAATD